MGHYYLRSQPYKLLMTATPRPLCHLIGRGIVMAARGLVRAPRSARLVRLLVSAPIMVTAQYTAMQKREPL